MTVVNQTVKVEDTPDRKQARQQALSGLAVLTHTHLVPLTSLRLHIKLPSLTVLFSTAGWFLKRLWERSNKS